MRALLPIVGLSLALPLLSVAAAQPILTDAPSGSIQEAFRPNGPTLYLGYRGELQSAAEKLETAGDVAGAEGVWRDGVRKAPAEDAASATEGYADFLTEHKRYVEAAGLYLNLVKALSVDDSSALSYLAKIARIQFISGNENAANLTLDSVLARVNVLSEQEAPGISYIASTFEDAGRYIDAEGIRRKALAGMTQMLVKYPQISSQSQLTDHMRFELSQNLLLQKRYQPTVITDARHMVTVWRARQEAVFGQPIQALTEAGARAEGRELLNALAAADWLAAKNGGNADALQFEAFGALQDMMHDQATQALVLAAARKSAQRAAGLGDLVRQRQALSDHWLELFNARSMILSSGGDALASLADLDRKRDDTVARIRNVDRIIEKKFPRFFAIIHPRSLSAGEARALLKPDEAVLIIVPGRFGTSLIAITREGVSWKMVDLSEEKVSRMVARLRQDLDISRSTTGLPGFDSETAYGLYAAFIEPMNTAIGAKTHLFIAADGALATLPFGVLLTQPPKPGEDSSFPEVLQKLPWFADAHAIVQIPSLQSLAFLRGQHDAMTNGSAKAEFAGYGDPKLVGSARARGGGELPALRPGWLVGQGATELGAPLMDPERLRGLHRLPGTKTELVSIQASLGAPTTALHLQEAMTEHGIKADSDAGRLASTRIIDIATHGLTAGESGARAEPGLVFSPPQRASDDDDGYLSASEVVGLDLSGTEWVILSACNSGAPSGFGNPGLSGLVRSFFYAGASDLLVSHWPVFDSVAAELTARTLRNARKPGTSRAQALQSAMREVRSDVSFAHPSAWAPFSLIGDR